MSSASMNEIIELSAKVEAFWRDTLWYCNFDTQNIRNIGAFKTLIVTGC